MCPILNDQAVVWHAGCCQLMFSAGKARWRVGGQGRELSSKSFSVSVPPSSTSRYAYPPTPPPTKSICRADVGKWLAHLRASHLWTSPPPVYSSILCFWPFHYLHGSLPATPLSPRRDRYETKCGDMCCRGPLWHWPQRESVISSFYFFSFTLISINVWDRARICNTHACLCVCVFFSVILELLMLYGVLLLSWDGCLLRVLFMFTKLTNYKI